MVAYWIARAKVNKPEEYKKYTDCIPAILAKYNAKVLARGGRHQVLEGPDRFHRFVIIEFPTLEAATEAYDSAEYQHAKQHRLNGVGEVETIVVEADDAL